MKRLYLVGWFLFLSVIAFAQDKITDFENIATQSINQVYYADTNRNKLLFFVNMPERSTSLWVSDGTKDGTRILKDSLGQSPERYYPKPVKNYGYSYIWASSLWRTDGNELKRLPIGVDSLRDLQLFAQKLLVYFQYSKRVADKADVNVSSFGWLDSLNQVTIWETNVISYQIIDNTLHYVKLNKDTQNYELHKVLSDNTHRVNIISAAGVQIYSFGYFLKNNYDYYFFNTNQGWKLCSKPADDEQTAYLQQWGSNEWIYGIRRFIITDTQNNEYLLKFSKGIQIYSITANNQLVEKWSVPVDGFRPDADKGPNHANIIGNMSISGNKLLYTNAYLSESIGGFKLNVMDLSSFKYKRSKDLQDYVRFSYHDNMALSEQDTNTYVIDNNYGKTLTYSFAFDSTLRIEPYPYKSPLQIDTLFLANEHRLLLTDNIYNVTNGKQPLIPTRSIFLPDANEAFFYRILTDKLLFWKYNFLLRQYELWASNGNKNNSDLLLTFGEWFDDRQIIVIDKKVYFWGSVNETKNILYETDGTKEGTKKIMETENISYARANKKQGVLVTSKREVIVIENEKVSYISNIPQTKHGFQLYLTEQQVYLLTYDIADNGGVYYDLFRVENSKLIDIDKNVGQVLIYKSQVFYTKRNALAGNDIFSLYELSQTGKITERIKGLSDVYIYGAKLIYQQFNGVDKPLKTTVLDIVTSKIDLTIDDFHVLVISTVGDALLFMSQSKSLLIKGSRRKDIKELKLGVEFRPFGNGFVIRNLINSNSNDLSSFSFDYFDLADESIVRIGVGNGLNIGEKSGFLLIDNRIDNTTVKWSYWTAKNKKLIELGDQHAFFDIDSAHVFSNNRKGETFYWYFDGTYLTQRYQVDYPYAKFKTGNDTYMISSSTETGSELVRLGSESLITYPEIVTGPEGIDVRRIFNFNNQLYLYGFTFTHGWQVWKMAKENPQPVLSTESLDKKELVVYPNPVGDFLSIRTDRGGTYSIIDVKGHELMRGILTTGDVIDLKDIPTGIYIITFFDGKQSFSKKIIKY